MIRIGKTYGNLMVDVQVGSEKLRDRARRIVHIVTDLDYDDADKLLKAAHWNVKAAIVMQKTGLTYAKALSRLKKSDDLVREAIPDPQKLVKHCPAADESAVADVDVPRQQHRVSDDVLVPQHHVMGQVAADH